MVAFLIGVAVWYAMGLPLYFGSVSKKIALWVTVWFLALAPVALA
jgi:hypothetical protein